MTYTKKTKARGGKVFLQVDIFKDQEEMIQRYIERNGETKAHTVRLALDAFLKPKYEKEN